MHLRRLAFLTVFLPCFLLAQKEDLQFEHLSMKDGLSMNPVMSIVQDTRGFLWFGTQDGLNRYDGYNFVVYKSKDTDTLSISDNFITSLCVDNKGRLCIGTLYGFNIYDPKTNLFRRFIKNNDNFPSEKIYCLFKDKNGLIWIGTEEGLALFDPATDRLVSLKNKFPNIPGLHQKTVLCIYQDSKGTYWFGTTSGLVHYIPTIHTHNDYFSGNENGSLSSNIILSVYEDKKNNLWIGTLDGLNKYDHSNNTFSTYYFKKSPEELVSTRRNNALAGSNIYSIVNNYGGNTIRCILEDKEGSLWIGTDMELIIFNPKSGNFINYKKDLINPNGINDHFIRSIFLDNSDNLWVGTLGNGLNKVNLKSKKFQHYQKKINNHLSLSENYVRSICEDSKGQVWVGTLLGGLNCFDPKSGNFTHYTKNNSGNSIIDDNVWSVCYDQKENALWLGTNNGLNRLDLNTGKFTSYQHNEKKQYAISDNTVRCVFLDSKNNLWCGTENGLNRFDKETQHFRYYNKFNSSISNNTVWKILEDKNGKLWLATNDGLDCFDPASEVFFVYKKIPGNQNSLSHNAVRTVYLDKNDFLWIGTQNGLNKLNLRTLDFTRYYEADGLPNPFIYAITEDRNDHLWISTNKGLSDFDKEKTFKNYDISDGLQDYEFNTNACFRTAEGEIYFGGPSGLNRFHPQVLKANSFVPPVVITEIKIQDKLYSGLVDASALTELTLGYDENNIAISYSALDFTNPTHNQYMCKLENFNNNWINAGNRRFISYTNLDPGRYTFMVKGSNSDGLWNQKITTLKITVLPPFWKTWWFYLLCLLAVLIGFYTYMRLRTRSLLRIKKELEKMVSERTLQVEKQKDELAQKNKDITDSINYAKRIQNAILPSDRTLLENFEEAFVFYKPRDIVSGDLYWFTRVNPQATPLVDLRVVAAVDCTGHGVPGAFMSLIASELLNQTIKKKDVNSPADVLRFLNKRIPFALNKNNTERLSDGMDIAVCAIDLQNMNLYYSGANRPLWIVNKQGEFTEIKPTKASVGGYTKHHQVFENHHININKGDIIYLFTDGYADQFGGSRNKKIGTKQLKELLHSNAALPLTQQKQKLYEFYENWKGDTEQIDDILIIGIRV